MLHVFAEREYKEELINFEAKTSEIFIEMFIYV
jgi:hypothetical protein